MRQITGGLGESIPFACQDWANTKAAYRFFSNPRVVSSDILRGHFQSTQNRISAAGTKILVLHDTTSFSYQRCEPQMIGKIGNLTGLKQKNARQRLCGMFMHSSLAITPKGLPLGLTAVKFWSRKQYKRTNALKRKINPTRVCIEDKESIRWLENLKDSTPDFSDARKYVHIADREGDIFELFSMAKERGTHFVIRTCVDRRSGEGNQCVSEAMKEVRVKGHHWIEVRDSHGHEIPVLLNIKYHRLRIQPPVGKENHYSSLILTVIHAQEVGQPKNRERINWKLATNLPVESPRAAIEKIGWYALRWKIEVFHKILKSGCKVEESKMRSSSRLSNLIAVFDILAWRIFWMTMVQRADGGLKPSVALTQVEITILDKLKPCASHDGSLGSYLRKIAMLGGYLARTNDPPPGNKVMWRGLTRLMDIHLGYILQSNNVGN